MFLNIYAIKTTNQYDIVSRKVMNLLVQNVISGPHHCYLAFFFWTKKSYFQKNPAKYWLQYKKGMRFIASGVVLTVNDP